MAVRSSLKVRSRIIEPSSRTTKTSIRFAGRVEDAVGDLAPKLHEAATAHRIRWFGRVLRRIWPRVSQLTIERRALEERARRVEPEILYIEGLITEAAQELEDPDLTSLLEDLPERVAVQYGFLGRDPRTRTLMDATEKLIEDDLFSYWRGLTDPRALARDIYSLRAEGYSYQPLYQALAGKYRAGFFSAERLVRTTYTASANTAAQESVKKDGYDGKGWLSSRDARVRRQKPNQPFDHAELDGLEVPVDEPFESPVSGQRMMFPGDRSLGAHGGEIYNCRCTIIGVMLEGKPKPKRREQLEEESRAPEPDAEPTRRGELGTGPEVRRQLEELPDVRELRQMEQQLEELYGQRREREQEYRELFREFGEVRRDPAKRDRADELVELMDTHNAGSDEMQDRINKLQTARAQKSMEARERALTVLNPEGTKAKINMSLHGPDRRTNEGYEDAMDEFGRLVGDGVISEKSAETRVGMFDIPESEEQRAFFRGRVEGAYDEAGRRIVKPLPGEVHMPIRYAPRAPAMRETMIHEAGHYWEHIDSDQLRLAKDFLDRRTAGEEPVKLKDLFPGHGYRDDEITKVDKFKEPYMGKIYTRATEITSMGLEGVYKDPLGFAQEDPDYFDFIIDSLRRNRRGS